MTPRRWTSTRSRRAAGRRAGQGYPVGEDKAQDRRLQAWRESAEPEPTLEPTRAIIACHHHLAGDCVTLLLSGVVARRPSWWCFCKEVLREMIFTVF